MRELEHVTTTRHSIDRASERCNIKNRSELERKAALARKHGLRPSDLARASDRAYLKARMHEDDRSAIVFDGLCFIMNAAEDVFISVFPVPYGFGQSSRGKKDTSKLPFVKVYCERYEKYGYDFEDCDIYGNTYDYCA